MARVVAKDMGSDARQAYRKNVDQIYMLSWRVTYDSSVITNRQHDAA